MQHPPMPPPARPQSADPRLVKLLLMLLRCLLLALLQICCKLSTSRLGTTRGDQTFDVIDLTRLTGVRFGPKAGIYSCTAVTVR